MNQKGEQWMYNTSFFNNKTTQHAVHLQNNYKSINFLKDIGYNNIVINNDLTINEIKDIIKNTKSNLYYFYTSKNMLMYSRRNLVTNYNKYYNIKTDKKTVIIYSRDLNGAKPGDIVFYEILFKDSKFCSFLDRYIGHWKNDSTFR